MTCRRTEAPAASESIAGTNAAATAFPLATDAAHEMLRAGGNAVDAAVAAAWALGVCEPSASGIGGQSVLLIRFADGRSLVLDGHSHAPAATSLRTIGAEQQRRGYRSSTVPSTPAVLRHALERYGALTHERAMAPAIRIAEEGFAVTPLLHRQIRWVADDLRASSRPELFLRNGAPPPVGHVLRQPSLAATLRRLSNVGIDDFYRGRTAHLIAEDMRRHGGLITEEDLAGCAPPEEREPIAAHYRGYRILTVPPPGGGLQLLLALAVLEQLAPEASEAPGADWYESIALTVSAVFRERERQDVTPDHHFGGDGQLSEALARRVAAEIRDAPAPRARALAEEPGDTTHLSIADRHGNVVLLTQSIQSVFGAKVAHPTLGFLYNNYLCTCPRYPHRYALRERCRPRSNAAPTLVLKGGRDGERAVLGLGAAGSRRITSSVLQVVSRVLDHGLKVGAAVAAPRAHGLLSGKVWIERPAASDTLLQRLERRGLRPIVKSAHAYAMGSVQALQFLPGGTVLVAADPRRDGTACVRQSAT